ncbi:MAG TPA: DNA polymerase V [Sutterella sp.]|nr:DNA polymerase V [Sutterella sp.]
MSKKSGGARVGAGRKPLSATSDSVRTGVLLTAEQKAKMLRLGGSRWVRAQIDAVKELPSDFSPVLPLSRLSIPIAGSSVQAGFPSPAESYAQDAIDFNDILVKCPPATFAVRAKGSSMVEAGIAEGDLLVVDRSIEARPGSIVIMRVNDEFTVKRLLKNGDGIYLHPENTSGEFTDIYPTEGDEWEIFGVVTFVLKAL